MLAADKKQCQRRECKAHFGELVQLDGTFHDWLEGRGPRSCLMNMVDDATGRMVSTSTEKRRDDLGGRGGVAGLDGTVWCAVPLPPTLQGSESSR